MLIGLVRYRVFGFFFGFIDCKLCIYLVNGLVVVIFLLILFFVEEWIIERKSYEVCKIKIGILIN